MSKSRKRTPVCCWVCCKSQKRGKQICNRKFRRREHQCISVGDYEELPLYTIEVISSWDLGGDGKAYQHGDPQEEWFTKMMRK